ncbi:hypothetical protein [Streptomyces sp. NPDC090445]|uniref:hypothetical protein n=1 Tax=Streptomyces sp. NPDC090445 TaxID=3365963 RepID=UPI0038253E09
MFGYAWLALLAPFTLDLAAHAARPTATGLVVAATVWLATVLLARLLDGRGDGRDRPGPAEAVLRRLTYGPAPSSGPAKDGPLPAVRDGKGA